MTEHRPLSPNVGRARCPHRAAAGTRVLPLNYAVPHLGALRTARPTLEGRV
jgi:hypothetical protein